MFSRDLATRQPLGIGAADVRRLADQQVHTLRHHDVLNQPKTKFASHTARELGDGELGDGRDVSLNLYALKRGQTGRFPYSISNAVNLTSMLYLVSFLAAASPLPFVL